MANVKVYNMKNVVVDEIELNDAYFQREYNEALIHQAVVTRLANERQGTKGSLTRTEVRGGGKKPFRQKGTGNARQGSTRAPHFIKGGVVFAPKARDFSIKMNKKAKIAALYTALSKKLADEKLVIIDEVAVENGKTKEMKAFVEAFGFESSVLVVMCNNDDKVIRAASNLQKLGTLPVEQLSTYEVVKYNTIVLAKGSVEKLMEVHGK